MDKAGQQYWERGYKATASGTSARGFDPHRGGTRDFWKRKFHEYFQFAFSSLDTHGLRLVEVGAGGSSILPYLGREFGFHVVGLDYATAGCALAEENLLREGINGEVICADVFDPPASELDRADVLVSFGVVEHFSDPADCVRACARLLKPGGLMVTTVPNMAGLTGRLQRALDPAVYEKHVALNADRLRSAHERAGLQVLDTRYVLFAHLGVVNINEAHAGIGGVVRSMVLGGLKALTAMLWFVEKRVGSLPANAATSPYVFCLARKPSA
jgi:2-polyprenyl-3-methyl-5-hydroxy-6-metoxy-1,4-benzoquinol methylase